MAPLKPIQKDPTDERVQPILNFSTEIARTVNDRTSISAKTMRELEAFIERPFPSHSALVFARSCSDFEVQGSSLWNAATKIIRDVGDDDEFGPKPDLLRFGVLLRAFAFFMVDAASSVSPNRSKGCDERVRNFKVALKASRSCLESGDLQLTSKIIEAASKYIAAWEETIPMIHVADSAMGDEKSAIHRLISDFYLLRMAHASKSGRHDLSDHFFSKANINGQASDEDLLETAAGHCLEIGRLQLQSKSEENAVLWLERAYELLNSDALALRSLETEDLRLAIVAALIEALPFDDPGDRAWGLVLGLEQEHGLGDRNIVLIMQLNVLTRKGSADIDTAATILSRMVRCTVLTDQTYLTLMRSIHKVGKVCFRVAFDALEQMISARLLPDLDALMEHDQVKDWLQKAVVTYVNMGTTATEEDRENILEDISRIFDQIAQQSSDTLSPKATHAIQALIWKASKDASPSDGDIWLGLLQHAIFDGVGATNKARVARKVMLTALERGDFDTARAAFYQMPLSAQNEGVTRYLAYKLALKASDAQLAGQCVHALVKNANKDQRYLYACVLEAQRSGNRAIAASAFQALVDQPPNSIQLPALLRCTCRLLMEELDNPSRPLEEATHELSRIFRTAAANMKALSQGGEEQRRAEIQWWSKNAFNMSLQLCEETKPEHLVRLLRACNRFLDCYPDEIFLMHQDDLVQRKEVCHFLCASAFVVLGRSTQDRTQQLQQYLEVQREVNDFLVLWQQPDHQTPDGGLRRARAFEVLKFNVESVFRLEQWDKLDDALTACLDFQGTVRWDTLADLVIIIYERTKNLSPNSSATTKIPELLQKIINETWSADKDISKLARWLRLTFSISVSDADGGISIKLVEQAASLARRGTEGRNEPYPEDELQWLSTVAFNKFVDLLAGGDSETASQWSEASLELARYAADNGSLHAFLTRNREEAERRLRKQ